MKHMQIKTKERSLKTSLADEGFLDPYHTTLIFHLKEENPFSETETETNMPNSS